MNDNIGYIRYARKEQRKCVFVEDGKLEIQLLALIGSAKGEIIFQRDNVHSTMLEAQPRKRFIDYGIRGLEWPTRSPDPNFARKSMDHYRAGSLHGKELPETLKQKGIDARNYKLLRKARNTVVKIN